MISAAEYTYDLFISCADADRAWVEGYLLDALARAGVRYYSEAAFALGVPRLLEFERAVQQSRRTLLVLSPAYLADGFTQFTDLLIQTYGLETATWPVIPLILQPVRLPPRLAMLTALDGTDPADWPGVIERLCAELQRPVPPSPPSLSCGQAQGPPCPYPGMVPFGEADSRRFFGRDREVQELLERLRLHPFLAVIGPSGCGKSSLVFAGLIPVLRRSSLFRGSGDWLVRIMRPGAAPLSALQETLGDVINVHPDGYKQTWERSNVQPFLLVVDQFEEAFTVAREDTGPFQQALLRLAGVPNCYVILTARADFYPDLMATSLWPRIQAHRFEVLPLGDDGLRQAIVRPAEDVGVYVEAALVERLIADAAGEPGILPLIQETLVLLWERVERRFLPLRAYEALILPRRAYDVPGDARRTGLQVAMARRADATLADLTPEQQAIARRIFLRLVQFGEGRADTRRQQPVAELRFAGDDPLLFDETLRRLTDGRLLTLSGEAESALLPPDSRRSVLPPELGGRGGRADIAHEALIAGWPTLQGWIQTRREAEQTRRRLEDKAAEWARLGRSSGGLLDEVELHEAERWLASPDAADLGYDEVLPALVEASRQAIRRALWMRIGAVTLAVLFLITAIAVYALQQRTTAWLEAGLRRQVEAQLAVARSRQVAATVRNRLDEGQAQQAVLLGIAAVQQITETVQADNVLRDALDAWRGEDILTGHTERVYRVAFSPNDQYLATISNDDTARLWQLIGERRVLALRGHIGDLTHVAFSHDSRLLVTASRDGTARVWEVSSGRPLHILNHGGQVIALDISPDGQTIATGGEDNQVRLWHLEDGQPARAEPFRAEGAVQDVTFSPDGIFLVAASTDGTAWLWHLPSGQFARLTGHATVVSRVAFSPDGRYLATISGDTVRMWDMDGLKPVALAQAQHGAAIMNLAFSPDSHFLATASQDATARLWDLRRLDADPIVLRGHTEAVWGVLFSPDSRLLVTTSWDDTARLWRVDGGRLDAVLAGHAAEVWEPAFSPDGSLLATPDEGGVVRLWRAQAGGDIARHATRSLPATALALAGEQVVVAGEDGNVELWNPSAGTTRVYTVGSSRLDAVAASLDGAHLAVGGVDGQITIVDAATGTVEAAWPAHPNGVRALLFLPDGVHLASAGADTTIRLWDLRMGQPGIELRGHRNDVNGLALGADPATLISASSDGTVRLWNWQTGESLARAGLLTEPREQGEKSVTAGGKVARSETGHSGGQSGKQSTFNAGEPLLAVALSPDRRWLATGGRGPAVYIWDLATPDAAPLSLAHEATVRSLAFSPDGRRLASGDEDGTIRLWDLQAQEATTIRAHSLRWASGVAFSPDGSLLFSVGGDGEVRAWPVPTADVLALACRRAGRNLSDTEWGKFLPFIPFTELCQGVTSAPWAVSEQLDPPRPVPPPALWVTDNRPTIYYFEAVPGSMVRFGESVALRWDGAGATAVYLEYQGQRYGKTAPREELFSPAEDTVYRLVAVNRAGERSLTLTVSVRRE